MVDGVSIRASVPDDRATILDLWSAEGGFCDRCTHPAGRKRWPKVLAHVLTLSSVFVATMLVDETEVIVGFVVTELPAREKHHAILHALFVRPECRLTGIARALWGAANLTSPVILTHLDNVHTMQLLHRKRIAATLDASLFWRHHDAANPPAATSQGRAHAPVSDRTASA